MAKKLRRYMLHTSSLLVEIHKTRIIVFRKRVGERERDSERERERRIKYEMKRTIQTDAPIPILD